MVKFNFSAFAWASEDSDDSVESVTPRQRPPVETRSAGTSDFASPRSADSGSMGGERALTFRLVSFLWRTPIRCVVVSSGRIQEGFFALFPLTVVLQNPTGDMEESLPSRTGRGMSKP